MQREMRDGSRWAGAFVALLLAICCEAVRAEPKYFYVHFFSGKFSSAAEACEAYRQKEQAAYDAAGVNVTTFVTKVSDEDTGYEGNIWGVCTIHARWVLSNGAPIERDLVVGYISGGCRPGRQPKHDAPEVFFEPNHCIDSPISPSGSAAEASSCRVDGSGPDGFQTPHPIRPATAENHLSSWRCASWLISPLGSV
jgi:hypothetical protein